MLLYLDHLKNQSDIVHWLILLTETNWFKHTSADNMSLVCEHKSTSKAHNCVKAFYLCKTCTDTNGGMYPVYVCFNCAVGGKLKFEIDNPRGAKLRITGQIELSDGEVVGGRSISNKDGSLHGFCPILYSKSDKQKRPKSEKQNLAIDQKVEKQESVISRERMLRNQQILTETSHQPLQPHIIQKVDHKDGIIEIIKSQHQSDTDSLTRLYLLHTAGGSTTAQMVQTEEDGEEAYMTYLSEVEHDEKRLKISHTTPTVPREHLTAHGHNSDDSHTRNLSSSFVPSPLGTSSTASFDVPFNATIGSVTNPFLSDTSTSTPCSLVGSMFSPLADMSPVPATVQANTLYAPGLGTFISHPLAHQGVNLPSTSGSISPPSLPPRQVPKTRTLQELVTSGHVKDNGPPQPNGKRFQYYCAYCHSPVQIGFCNCEIGKRCAYLTTDIASN